MERRRTAGERGGVIVNRVDSSLRKETKALLGVRERVTDNLVDILETSVSMASRLLSPGRWISSRVSPTGEIENGGAIW